MSGLNLGNKPPAAETPANESTPGKDTADELVSNADVLWSSHPIQRFSVGDWVFENGLLRLNGDDVGKFQADFDQLPVYEQSRIKKLDPEAAARQVRAVLAANPGATKQIDSSVGDRATNKSVGTGTLGDQQ